MHAHVVAVQTRPVSPPSSPRARSSLTAAELLQTTTYAATTAPTSSSPAHTTLPTSKLFQYFDVDGEITPGTYDPPFDRNDLYFTNAAEARRLFELEASLSVRAKDRVARGLPAVDLSTCPFLSIVVIRFCGFGGERPCSYLTWCLTSEARTTFLGDVLSRAVPCNRLFTELLDRCATGSSMTTGAGVRLTALFSIETIDDSVGTVTRRSLPVFLATLTGYVDQYATATVATAARGGSGSGSGSRVGRTTGGASPASCLNLVSPIPHARHRLISECGSVDAFRLNWLYAKAARGFIDKISFLQRTLRECLDIVDTFFDRYYTHLSAAPVALCSSRTAPYELNGLWDLFQQYFDRGIIDKIGELSAHFMMTKQIAGERKTNVDRAYAAAMVSQFKHRGTQIPETLSVLYADTIEDSEFRVTHGLYTSMGRMMKQLTRVKQTMIEAWAGVRDDVKDPEDMFLLLRSLVVLRLWSPYRVVTVPAAPTSRPADAGGGAPDEGCASGTGTTAAADATLEFVNRETVALEARFRRLAEALGNAAFVQPPAVLAATEIRHAYLKCHRDEHPDKCSTVDKDVATVRTQMINEANERLTRLYGETSRTDFPS
jgi:hypothetical protein